jgi:hypothetical protein
MTTQRDFHSELADLEDEKVAQLQGGSDRHG